jgi:exosortase
MFIHSVLLDAFPVKARIGERLKEMLKNLSIHLTETRITLGVKIAVAIAAIIALFSQDLTILFNDAFQSESTSHLLAIPFLFAYLIYRKRKMLRAVAPLENWNEPKETRHLPTVAGILLLATAVLLYWYGSHTFTPIEYHMFALPIFAAGLTLLIFNPQTLRQLAFPICFLIFLMPPPSEILYALGATLSIISSEASNAIVNAFGIPSTITSEYGNPTIIITRPDGTAIPFTVDIACSGIYSLIGFLIFAVFIAYIIRDKPWKKLVLILVGLPLIYFLNIIRITIILILGYHYGEALALQAFHLLGGWILIFLGTLLLLAISEKVFKTQIFTASTEKCPQCNPKPQSSEDFCPSCGRLLKPPSITISQVDVVKIAAITASLMLLMSIQAPVFALTEASPIVIIDTPSGQQISTTILPQVSDYTLSFWYRDTQFEIKAKQDMSLIYLYSPINQSKEPVWVTIEIASTRSSLHRWETCLITWPLSKGYQPKVTQIELKDVQLTQNPPIISRYFVFNYTATNETQAVLYWYETATFTVNSTSQQKHVKISLITYPETMEDLPDIENQMIALATAVANYWQPIKTWSQITMLISQNGASLAATTSAMLIAIVVLYLFENRKRRKANTNAYLKLSIPNRQIVDAVREAEKITMPTMDNIAKTHQKTTGKPIDKKQLQQKLSELEKTEIVKGTIANRQDEPIQIWKTQITF